MKNIKCFKNIKLYFIKNWILFLVGLIVSVCVVIAAGIMFKNPSGKIDAFYIFSFITVIVTVIVFWASVMLIRIKKIGVEKIYLICGLVFGILYLFIIPPYATPDEEIHINSAYQMSNQLIFDTNENDAKLLIESSLSEYAINMRQCDQNLSFSHEIYRSTYDYLFADFFHNSVSKDVTVVQKRVTRPTLVYLFSGTGIAIGRLLGLPPTAVIMLGALFNVILFVSCAYFSIKLLPFGKLALFAICLAPMTLQQTSSYSSDNIVLSCTVLMTAIALRMMYDRQFTLKRMICFGVATLFLAFSKGGVYSLFVILPFLLCFSKDDITKKRIIVFLVLSMGTLFIVLRGGLIDVTSAIDVAKTSPQGGAYIDWADKYAYSVRELLSNPFRLASLLKNTVIKNGSWYIETMIGSSLSWFTVHLPRIMCYFYLVLIILGSLVNESDNENVFLKRFHKIVMWVVILSVVGGCFAAMLLTWTPKSSNVIKGLQGRYFLPVLFLAVLTLRNKMVVLKRNIEGIFVSSVIVFQLVTILLIFNSTSNAI